MSVSRRKLLVHGGLAGIFATLPSVLFARKNAIGLGDEDHSDKQHGKAHEASPVPMVRGSFVSHVGSTFTVQGGASAKGWLTLLSVEDMAAAPPINTASMAVPPKPAALQQKCDAFALHFRISSNQTFKQGTYTLDHNALGTFPLFVVAGERGSQTCTAIIAHVV